MSDKYAASTISNALSAIGTFGEFLGFERPRTDFVARLLKGNPR